jgi:hypothetical protein
MQFGDKCEELYELQEFLIGLDFMQEHEDFYGLDTLHGVRQLQEYLNLEPTGVFDESFYVLYDIKVYEDSMSIATLDLDNTIISGDNVTDNATTQQKFNESDADLGGLDFPCYIQNLITGTTIKIPSMIEDITWSKGNNFDEIETKGRSASYLGYANSSSKTMEFSFIVNIDILQKINEDVDSYSNKLEALAYPRYGSYTVPPKAFFRCGNIRLEGVVTEVSVVTKPPIIDGKYSILEVSISMTETYDEGMSATTIEAGGK